jgi:hypothetical protein
MVKALAKWVYESWCDVSSPACPEAVARDVQNAFSFVQDSVGLQASRCVPVLLFFLCNDETNESLLRSQWLMNFIHYTQISEQLLIRYRHTCNSSFYLQCWCGDRAESMDVYARRLSECLFLYSPE